MKITKRRIRNLIKEALADQTAYHSTDPANISSIQQDGLQVGRESAHTIGGEWADEHYGTRPIYISMQKGRYEGQPLKIDTSNLSLVADLPGLVDTGAMIEEEGLYWDDGDEPPPGRSSGWSTPPSPWPGRPPAPSPCGGWR